MVINVKTIIVLLTISYTNNCFSQSHDTVYVRVNKQTELLDNQEIYTFTMKNWSQTPVCILHSTFINLFDNPPQRMAVFRETDTMNLYSLEYCAKDTLYDQEGPINNFNAEIILPLQQITFNLLLPKSNKNKKLKFEYAWVENFCYPVFKDSIFKNAAKWHERYKRIKQYIDLP